MATPIPDDHRTVLARIERRPSWPEALAAALLPLTGVLLFDWPVAAVLGLYWLDNVLVGLFHVLKMWAAQGRMLDPKYEAALRANAQWNDGQKEEMIRNATAFQHHVMPWFFGVHYGLFCAGHAAFIVFLFDGAFEGVGSAIGMATLAVMLVQHAFELRVFRRDAQSLALPRALLMFQPYPRVIALHIALLFGMAPALAGYPLVGAVLLAAVKLWIDRSQMFATLTLLRRER